MNAGRHASQDGSFVRSAGGAMSRGIILIVIAVVIGIVLIRTAVGDSTVAAGGEQSASTTEAASGTTDTTAAGTADTSVATTDTTAAGTTDTSVATTDTTAAGTTDTSVATTDTTAAGTTDTTTDDRGAVEPRPNAQVRVQVANTTAVAGAAGGQTDDFKALGYVTLKPTNSASGQGTLALTKIHHVGGYLLEAQQIAAELGLGNDAVFSMPDSPEALVADWEDPHILVLLGSDIAN
ncbi:MAG: LytR C-terminal domain-containing protein [Acidimicrobiales bacterium]